eukprot:UN20079
MKAFTSVFIKFRGNYIIFWILVVMFGDWSQCVEDDTTMGEDLILIAAIGKFLKYYLVLFSLVYNKSY